MLTLIEIRQKISSLKEELENLNELESKTFDKIYLKGLDLNMVSIVNDEPMVLVDCDLNRTYCRPINENNTLDYGFLASIPFDKFVEGTKYKKYTTYND